MPCTNLQELKKSQSKNEFLLQQKLYLDTIISITWALFNKAIEKNQPFIGGTIVIIDHNYALFDYLFNYICYVNPTIKQGKNFPYIIANNRFGYSRLSTHFPETRNLKNFSGQYGIDIRYGNGPLQPLLPLNKQHILFGKLPYITEIPLTFIKFETYGLVVEKQEMLKHLGKALEKKKKDITQQHNILYSRREDVPKDIQQKFKALFKELPIKEK